MSAISKLDVSQGAVYQAAIASVSDFNGPSIDCRGLTKLSFTIKWTADSGSTRAGRFKLQVSDDPAALTDPSNATWTDATFPSGSTDGDATVDTTTATIGSSAGKERVTLVDLPAYIRLIWDNTTAGTDGQITIWCHGK